MHQPRPHGTFGAKAATEEDAAAAELLARRVSNFKTVSGLDSFKMTRTLPSGAMAIAVDMGGVLRVIIQKQVREQPAVESDGLAKAYIPMLFSGVVTNAIVHPGEGVSLKLTKTTLQRLRSYDSTAPEPLANIALQRFVIEHNVRVSELKPKDPTTLTWTQYVNQRPTWYSGPMASVVQIVGGYGRQSLRELPDSKWERARLLLPAKVETEVVREIGNIRLPGYSGLPPVTGEFQYDYKHNETNGVAFDSNNRPWLLRVNPRGVYAMPLPIIPASSTRAFREYMEQVGDDEILWILDRFGGMPSGETFPAQPGSFESWRRAGAIIKVCDAGDFYNHLAYTSAIGWSFNTRGTEGFNTCYDYAPNGISYGLSFKLQISLGPAQREGKLPEGFDLSDPEQMLQLNSYLAMLYRQMPGNSARELAIKYKLRRVPVSDVLARVGKSGPGEVDYWDNLELAPIAAHSGRITQVARGNLYSNSPPRSQPQIKFPEPFLGGCVSHDFNRMEGSPLPSGIVKCDTTMFGYYVGDSLKVVKYFIDEGSYKRAAEDNFDECMTVGAWERTVTESDTTLMGRFYTSDIDEREAAASITTVTKIVGSDLGYDDPPMFAFDEFFSMVGSIWRNRWLQHKTTTTKTDGYAKAVAVCIPFLARNAVFHAMTETTSGGSMQEELAVEAVQDPHTYRFFTYDPLWAWRGGSVKGGTSTSAQGSPYPQNGNPVWVMGYSYSPSKCSDFADQGDWLGGRPADYRWLIHPNNEVWLSSGGGSRPTVKEYFRMQVVGARTDGALLVSFLPQVREVNRKPRETYFTTSPGEELFYVDAIRNEAGTATYASLSEPSPDSPGTRTRYGHTVLADHKDSHHFIGVVNE